VDTVKELNGYRLYFPNPKNGLENILNRNGYNIFYMNKSKTCFVIVSDKSGEAILRLLVVDEIPSQDIMHNIPETSQECIQSLIDRSHKLFDFCCSLPRYDVESFRYLVDMGRATLSDISNDPAQLNLISHLSLVGVLNLILLDKNMESEA
jgi:hypothetical protein